jgi:hypothetical protein
MSIEKQVYLNEVLVRFRHDGSLGGAHQIMMDVVVDTSTGEILTERARPAAPLDPAQVSTMLGEAFPRIALQVADLKDEVVRLTQERDGLKSATSPASPSSPVISDRQFYQGLALRGLCTQVEALDAVRIGVLPDALRAFVDAISDSDQRWATEMLLSGAKEFRRDHPFVNEIGAWAGLDMQDLDAFWAQCGSL